MAHVVLMGERDPHGAYGSVWPMCCSWVNVAHMVLMGQCGPCGAPMQ